MKTFDPRKFVEKLMANTLKEKLNQDFVVKYAPSPKGGTLTVSHPDTDLQAQAQQIVDELIEKNS